jgi:tetratricopeptide (TPR) repeat protein
LDLDVPTTELEQTADVPVSDLLTESVEAYRRLVDAGRATLMQDWEAAALQLDQAVGIDPLFAYANLQRFSVHLALNDPETAQLAIERALESDYRLLESDRLSMKAVYYRIVRQDVARAFAVTRMHAELYPDDVQARLQLAQLHSEEGRYDSAAGHFERALEIDPGQYDLLVTLGVLAERQGQSEQSLEYYQRYAERFPESALSHVAVGAAYRALGRHAESLEAFERALLLDHSDPQALLGSGAALAAVGRLDETLDRFHEALEASHTATQRAEVYQLLEDYHQDRGEMGRAVEYMHRRWSELAEQGPFVQLQMKLQSLHTYVRAGRSAAAFDSLESFARQMPAAFQTMLPLGYAVVYLELEDADGLEGTVVELEEFIEQLGVGALNSFVEVARGKVLELRGQCEAALPHYDESLRLDATELDGYLHLARCHRILRDFGPAEQNAREYLRLRPYHPQGHYELALVLRDTGRRDEAIEHARLGANILANADRGFQLADDLRVLLESLRD